MSLAVRAVAEEQMDAADLDPATYAAVMTDLAQVNRLTMAYRPTLRFLAEAGADRKYLRVLDVGFGDGDMLRAIGRWGARRGIPIDLVGIDLNPSSATVAEAATDPALGIDYRTGDYRDLAGERFDLIVSSLVTHHMSESELLDFLAFMEAEAALGWLVNDLHRLALAHFGFPLLARLMRWHPIVRADGTLSIARSFRRADWATLLARADIADARIVRRFPFRLCVERTR